MIRRMICGALAALTVLLSGGIMDNNQVLAAEPAQSGNAIRAQGVWHRPNVTGAETDLNGICSVLDTFQETGINLVFLETFYHGMTVYKSQLIPYYTGFNAYNYSPYPDYLSAFVAEAEKRGIEVHAWVEDFYIGVEENYFTRHLSGWLMQTKSGSIRQSEGKDYGGYLFLDPANTDVRQYLVRYYDELLTKFPQIAGLNLDYIRYPVSSRSDDTGYTDAAMDGFAAKYGLTFPANATRDQKVAAVAERYNDWVTYRADQVTCFVGEVFEMVKKDHAGVLLSTAVFPEQGKSFGDKKQDFTTWLERGYLDIITPMAYYDDISSLKRALEGMLPDLSGCYCYAGISATYHNLSNDRVVDQMETCVETGADGFVFFGSQSILNNSKYIALLKGITAESGVPALPHTAAKTLFEKAAARVEKKLKSAGEPDANVKKLLEQLGDLKKASSDTSAAKMEKVEKQLRLLVEYNLSTYVDNPDIAREELEPLYRWIEIKAARLALKSDGEEPEPEPKPEPKPEPEPEPTEPSTAPTEPEPTEPSTAPTETADATQPTAPKRPEQNRALRNWIVGVGAAFAGLTTAIIAGFHAIRKGRKKQ